MGILLIGGSGQLGTAIKKELNLQGLEFSSPTTTELDICDQSKVNKFLDELRSTIIINCAAWTDVDGAESNPEGTYELNAIGTQNLAISARNYGARLIHISTDYVFSGEGKNEWNELDKHDPQSIYGKSKSEGERLALREFPEGTYIVRTAWLYSETRKNFALTMVKLALQGTGEVRVVNDQIGQPTFAGDLAKQILNLISSNAPAGIYHGTNSGQATWYEFALEIFEQVGSDVSRVIPVSTLDFPRPAIRPKFSVLGHDSWGNTSIEPMRDWRIALREAMPAIISAVNTKE
jgi:dTDP-4-dehydrorhamnose reductase